MNERAGSISRTLGFDLLRREGNKITTALLKPSYFQVTCLKKTSREH